MAEDPVLTPAGARVFEYFVIISSQKKNADENSGLIPVVTERWPPVDIAGALPFPDGIAPFAFPLGARMVRDGSANSLPLSHSFVTTAADGCRVFGVCLKFFEPVSDGVAAPRAFMLLSRWPFISAMRRTLAYIFRLSLSSQNSKLPVVERELVYLLSLPAPPAGRAVVQATIGEETIFLRRAAPNSRASAANLHYPLRMLAAALPPQALLMAWHALLLERSVVLVSSTASVLTPAALALTALLYPLRWRHVFVPLLPNAMDPQDVITAPVPFLIGLLRSDAKVDESEEADPSSADSVLEFAPKGVWVVDLDAGTVAPRGGSAEDVLPPLPQRAASKLSAALSAAIGPTHGPSSQWAQAVWSRLDDAFFFAPRPDSDESEALDVSDRFVILARAAAASPVESESEEVSNAAPAVKAIALTAPDSDGKDRLASTLRRIFFRFFVATLSPAVLEGALRAGFNAHAGRAALMAAAPADARSFLHNLSQTMMWSDFVCAAVGGADDHGEEAAAAARVDALFFSESCTAKANRSALAGRVVTRFPTPFISDARWAHSRVVLAVRQSASSAELSTDDSSKSYVYSPFPPRLDGAMWKLASGDELKAAPAFAGRYDEEDRAELPKSLRFKQQPSLALREAADSGDQPASVNSSYTATSAAYDADTLRDVALESWLLALEGALPTLVNAAGRSRAAEGALVVSASRSAASASLLIDAWKARAARSSLAPSLPVSRAYLRLACAAGAYALCREAMRDVVNAGGTLSRLDYAELTKAFALADQGIQPTQQLLSRERQRAATTSAVIEAAHQEGAGGMSAAHSHAPLDSAPRRAAVSAPSASPTRETISGDVLLADKFQGLVPVKREARASVRRTWRDASSDRAERTPRAVRAGSAAALARAAASPNPLSPPPLQLSSFCDYRNAENPFQPISPPPAPPASSLNTPDLPLREDEDAPLNLGDISIDTSRVFCKYCNTHVAAAVVRAGFRRGAGADYTTECPSPSCTAISPRSAKPARRRFVAQLYLSGMPAVKQVEWLPPAVVLRESRSIARGSVDNGAARAEAVSDPWGTGFAFYASSLFFSSLLLWREAGLTESALEHCVQRR